MSFRTLTLCLALCLGLIGAEAQAAEVDFKHKSFDGFVLPGKIDLPKGVAEKDVTRVVILVHGSGPQSMDLNLTTVTKGKKPNFFFRDVRDGLRKHKFAVLRYDKRSFALRGILKKNPAYAQSKAFKAFIKNPLKYFVDDLRSMITFAKKRLPKAKIILAGFSQGTYVALQAAHRNKDVAGVALSGFYAVPLLLLVHEQITYRPMHMMKRIDKNNDGTLSADELKNAGAVGMQIAAQAMVLDADGDGKISLDEIRGGNFVNLLKFQKRLTANTMQELKYPLITKVLKAAKFKVLFFQGLWDNQTPAYQAFAVRILARFVWQKQNIQFFFFKKRGHILDKRDRYDDLKYRTIDPKALTKMANEMHKAFKTTTPTTKPASR